MWRTCGSTVSPRSVAEFANVAQCCAPMRHARPHPSPGGSPSHPVGHRAHSPSTLTKALPLKIDGPEIEESFSSTISLHSHGTCDVKDPRRLGRSCARRAFPPDRRRSHTTPSVASRQHTKCRVSSESSVLSVHNVLPRRGSGIRSPADAAWSEPWAVQPQAPKAPKALLSVNDSAKHEVCQQIGFGGCV
jgi:hypothetical protein